ncbi:MAG: hypothetical protein EPO40_21375 [Myxococcaceae bacterium]|nr:MAG: hypothetical protein EPO40_21375 [Myxococcaceae bacterium]
MVQNLRAVPTPEGPAPGWLDALQRRVERVEAEVAEGGPLGQMVHQHLDAYLVNAGLSPASFDRLKILRAKRP